MSVLIGGTFPLTGAASLFKSIPFAEKAYFDYVNDHGGVNGRMITFEIVDDSYDLISSRGKRGTKATKRA